MGHSFVQCLTSLRLILDIVPGKGWSRGTQGIISARPVDEGSPLDILILVLEEKNGSVASSSGTSERRAALAVKLRSL